MDSKIIQLAPNTVKLECTAPECEEIAQLLDVAVKAGGLRVAAVALKYLDRINAAITALKSSAA